MAPPPAEEDESKAVMATTPADETTPLLVTDDEPPKALAAEKIRHDEILAETRRSVYLVMVLGCITMLTWSARLSVFVLFARTLPGASTAAISVVTGATFIVSGLGGASLATAGDKFGFDTVIIPAFIFRTFGILLEATAPNFSVLTAGILISATTPTALILGYIQWMLPLKSARATSAAFYGLYMVITALGPVCSSLMAAIAGLRSVFYLMMALCVMMTVVLLVAFRNTQGRLEAMQAEMIDWYRAHPVPAEGADADADADTEAPADADADAIPAEERFPSAVYRLHAGDAVGPTSAPPPGTLSRWEWASLASILFLFATQFGCDGVFNVYFAVFMVDKFGSSVSLGTLQLALLGVSTGAGMWAGQLLDKAKGRLPKAVTTRWISYVAAALAAIALTALVMPRESVPQMFFLWVPVFGTLLGVSVVNMEFMLIDLQPPHMAGGLNGIRALLRNMARALAMLAVGMLIGQDPDWCFYVIAILLAAVLAGFLVTAPCVLQAGRRKVLM